MSRCQITTTHTCIHVYKKVQVVDHITTVNHTHVYTHDPMKSNWADYAVHVIRNCVGTHPGNQLTNNSSGTACPVISAHCAVGWSLAFKESGITVLTVIIIINVSACNCNKCKLISTTTTKKRWEFGFVEPSPIILTCRCIHQRMWLQWGKGQT